MTTIIKQVWLLLKVIAVVFYENWLRYPQRSGTLIINLEKYSVRVEPEPEKKK